MAEILAAVGEVSKLSLPTLLILILVGGYRKWWVWGWALTEAEARHAREIEACEKRSAEWKNIAMTGRDIVRGAVESLRGQ